MLSSVFPRAHARYSSLPILGASLEGLCRWMSAKGYAADALHRRVEAARLLEGRLRARRVRSLHDLTERELRAIAPRPTRWTALLAGALVRSLAEYLAATGGLARGPVTPADECLDAYRGYLGRVRGLAPITIEKHAAMIREFLAFLDHDARPEHLGALRVEEIEEYIARTGRRLSRVSMQHVTASLRAFLRFLAAEGRVPPGLDAYVESPRIFRGERLPRALPWDAVQALLLAVDRSTEKGRRDYAMLLLVATYGLRAGEVAALRLDHVEWRARVIRVPRPKIGTALAVPLTDDVAVALLDYLRHRRPPCATREVFVRVRAPAGPIHADTVSDVFDVWAARAGIPLPAGRVGPHSIRHSVAMHLLRQGAALKTIGDLLGHRGVESTCVYLRLQVEDLRDVALPLPVAGDAQVRP